MNYRRSIHIDNRDSGQMYEYLEARIDVLKRRISELEQENQVLRDVSNSEVVRFEDISSLGRCGR